MAAPIAYMFNAEILCPECTILALPTREGERYDGWRDVTGRMTAEQNLTELAMAFGVQRNDETTFDSGEFPKVVSRFDLEDGERCGNCNCELA